MQGRSEVLLILIFFSVTVLIRNYKLEIRKSKFFGVRPAEADKQQRSGGIWKIIKLEGLRWVPYLSVKIEWKSGGCAPLIAGFSHKGVFLVDKKKKKKQKTVKWAKRRKRDETTTNAAEQEKIRKQIENDNKKAGQTTTNVTRKRQFSLAAAAAACGKIIRKPQNKYDLINN